MLVPLYCACVFVGVPVSVTTMGQQHSCRSAMTLTRARQSLPTCLHYQDTYRSCYLSHPSSLPHSSLVIYSCPLSHSLHSQAHWLLVHCTSFRSSCCVYSVESHSGSDITSWMGFQTEAAAECCNHGNPHSTPPPALFTPPDKTLFCCLENSLGGGLLISCLICS